MSIDLAPVWQDHRFQGRAVLPAVEAMQLLAGWAQAWHSGLRVENMGQVRFDKFLELPAGASRVDVFCDLAELPDGSVRAALLTRAPAKSAALTRTKEHARVHFLADHAFKPFIDDAVAWEGSVLAVAPARLYEELVPFGPGYHTIAEPLLLSSGGALTRVRAPEPPDYGETGSLGSPFVLDGAFHAACVWGQRYAGVVAFPVGIAERRVLRPAQPGETFIVRVVPVQADPQLLIFNLWILDADCRTCEAVLGVQMRDVSGGRWTPPGWVREAAGQ